MSPILLPLTLDYLMIPKVSPFDFKKANNGLEAWYKDSLTDLVKQTNYVQIWEAEDPMTFQLKVKFEFLKQTVPPAIPVVADLVDCNEVVYVTFNASQMGTVDGWTYLHFHKVFQWYQSPVMPSGQFHIRLRFTLQTNDVDVFYSEPINIQQEHENSVLIGYSHSANDYDMIFQRNFITFATQIAAGTKDPYSLIQSGALYRIRVFGGVYPVDETPASDDVIYTDQTHSNKMLSSQPFNVYRFIFGDNSGLSNWMADKINRVFSCEFVQVDGIYFTKNDGAAIERVYGEQRYPKSAWGLELIPYTNTYSKIYRGVMVKSGIGNLVIGAGFVLKSGTPSPDPFVPVLDPAAIEAQLNEILGEIIPGIQNQVDEIEDIKAALKVSIENKGVTVDDAPFVEYSLKVDEIQPTGWHPPTNWFQLDDEEPAAQYIIEQWEVYENQANPLSVLCRGAYTVEVYSDMSTLVSTVNVADNVQLSTYLNYSNFTKQLRTGVRMAIVMIKPQVGSNLTEYRWAVRHAHYPLDQMMCRKQSIINAPNLTVFRSNASTGIFTAPFFEDIYFKNHAITNYTAFLNSIQFVKRLRGTLFTNITNLNQAFRYSNCNLETYNTLNCAGNNVNFNLAFNQSNIVFKEDSLFIQNSQNVTDLTSAFAIGTSSANTFLRVIEFSSCAAVTTVTTFLTNQTRLQRLVVPAINVSFVIPACLMPHFELERLVMNDLFDRTATSAATLTCTGALGTLNPTVSSITGDGTTVTVVTQRPHGFSGTTQIVMAGWSDADFNGTFTITPVDKFTFTYTAAATGSPTGGTVNGMTELAAWAAANRNWIITY